MSTDSYLIVGSVDDEGLSFLQTWVKDSDSDQARHLVVKKVDGVETFAWQNQGNMLKPRMNHVSLVRSKFSRFNRC